MCNVGSRDSPTDLREPSPPPISGATSALTLLGYLLLHPKETKTVAHTPLWLARFLLLNVSTDTSGLQNVRFGREESIGSRG